MPTLRLLPTAPHACQTVLAPHQQPCGRPIPTLLHFTPHSLPARTPSAVRKHYHERLRLYARACLPHHYTAKRRRHRLSHTDRQRPGQPVSCMSTPTSTAPTTLLLLSPFTHYRPILRDLSCFLSLTLHRSQAAPTSFPYQSRPDQRPSHSQHVAFLIAIVGPRVTISRLHSSVKLVLSDRQSACQSQQHISTRQKLCKILLPEPNSQAWTSDTIRTGFA
jgi:hypothetical protein